MLKNAVVTEDSKSTLPPDIFRAAKEDDPVELARAIQHGQSLRDVEPNMLFTPMHVACINKSRHFLAAAIDGDIDVWSRDRNGRLIADHAWANQLADVHKRLVELMYPPGWSSPPLPFPSRDS